MEFLHDVAQTVEQCGWSAKPILSLGLWMMPGALVAIVLALTRHRTRMTGLGLAVAGAGLLIVALGVAGRQSGLAVMEAAVAHVDPVDAERIRHQGAGDARTCVVLGFSMGAWPLAVGLALACGGWARLRGAGSTSAILGGTGLWLGIFLLLGGFARHQHHLAKGDSFHSAVEPGDLARVLAHVQEDARASLLIALGAGLPIALLSGGALFFAFRKRVAPESDTSAA